MNYCRDDRLSETARQSNSGITNESSMFGVLNQLPRNNIETLETMNQRYKIQVSSTTEHELCRIKTYRVHFKIKSLSLK